MEWDGISQHSIAWFPAWSMVNGGYHGSFAQGYGLVVGAGSHDTRLRP